MSGDVFGNGMLLSKAIKLVAAFDHRHIFIDPNPDPARRWTERAAQRGERKAMHNLDLYYFEGTGGPKNTTTGSEWFQRAAEMGQQVGSCLGRAPLPRYHLCPARQSDRADESRPGKYRRRQHRVEAVRLACELPAHVGQSGERHDAV